MTSIAATDPIVLVDNDGIISDPATVGLTVTAAGNDVRVYPDVLALRLHSYVEGHRLGHDPITFS